MYLSQRVEDVRVQNCVFQNAFSIASIKAIRGRGGYIRNIRYEDCRLTNHNPEYQDTRYFRGAIYVDGFYGEETFDADAAVPVDEGTPLVEDICFQNLTIETTAGNAIYLCGLPEQHFRNIRMENIMAHGKYGMKVKNIDGLEQKNVSVTCSQGPVLSPGAS